MGNRNSRNKITDRASMMDFDIALGKLERDHSKLRKQAKQRKETKEKSRLTVKRKQKEYEIKKQKEEKEKLKLIKVENYMKHCEINLLKRKSICGEEFLLLKVVNIDGDEDKIKLPQSILESIMNEDGGDGGIASPLMFRLGIPKPNYKFPLSKQIISMMEETTSDNDNGDDDDMMEDNNDDLEAYRCELKERYIDYTHAGVMEFTMEEGCIGVPPSIAKRLSIPKETETSEENIITQIEVSRVTLPKGTECSVKPTEQAIRNGFYGLKDVEAVLEQSIVRTRTTLSIGDTLHGWHRGVQFDLEVQSLSPPDFSAVSCIDTDIALHINSPEPPKQQPVQKPPSPISKTLSPEPDQQQQQSQGHKLVETNSNPPLQQQSQGNHEQKINAQLPTEPPIDQIQNICLIQIRSRSGTIKRRFDITKSNVSDLFTFVSVSLQLDDNFQLVTRFPRNVYEKNNVEILVDAGFVQGQQLLMVEIAS